MTCPGSLYSSCIHLIFSLYARLVFSLLRGFYCKRNDSPGKCFADPVIQSAVYRELK